MKLSTLILFAILAGLVYLLYKNQAKLFLYLEGEQLTYTSCPCCCTGSEKVEPEFRCLYYGKGDRINNFIRIDKTRKNKCDQLACTMPVTYAYCDP